MSVDFQLATYSSLIVEELYEWDAGRMVLYVSMCQQ